MPIYPIINLKRVALVLSALTLALVAAVLLAVSGCGGSTPTSTVANDPAATRHTTATPGTHPAQTQITTAAPQANGARAAVIHECAAKAVGEDPAGMITCLSSHHVIVEGSPELVNCLQASHAIADFAACLMKAAR